MKLYESHALSSTRLDTKDIYVKKIVFLKTLDRDREALIIITVVQARGATLDGRFLAAIQPAHPFCSHFLEKVNLVHKRKRSKGREESSKPKKGDR